MIAKLLKNCLSHPEDLVARYGGEEFVILLPDTDEQGAVSLAERIRRKLEQTPFKVTEDQLKITVSVGLISLIPSRIDDRKRMFEQADTALYEAKNNGRNRVKVG